MVLTAEFSPASAQAPRTLPYRIGFLSVSHSSSSRRDAFVEGMRILGYEEGRDYVIESRYAGGKLDRLPSLAAELVQLKVDVIVLGSIPSALAAQKATKTIPIVVAAAGDFCREWSRGECGATRREYYGA